MPRSNVVQLHPTDPEAAFAWTLAELEGAPSRPPPGVAHALFEHARLVRRFAEHRRAQIAALPPELRAAAEEELRRLLDPHGLEVS